MNIERPDLDEVEPAVRAYIEALETKLEALETETNRRRSRERPVEPGIDTSEPTEPSEPPTTLNLVTISASGMAKRTPRHLYYRQRRGGMGVFDLEVPEDDPPTFLTIADESLSLLLITNQARAFRHPLNELNESPIRSRGQSLTARLPLRPDEHLAVIAPGQGSGYMVLLSQRGHVRRLRYHYLGENLRSGTLLYDLKELGSPAAACWTSGEGELFIATRQGRAIRFPEQRIPSTGCLGIRLDPDDTAVAITAVYPDSSVFLLGADGKGAIRLMSGFSPNKTPGTSGKVAMKTDHLVGAVTVADTDDIFIISQLGKIIRFQAVEVPAKEGVVQGVNCMALRADETVAVASSPIVNPS